MSDEQKQEQAGDKPEQAQQEKLQAHPAEGKREPTVVSMKDFQRGMAGLQSQRDKAQQQVRELSRQLEEALAEVRIAKEFGGDEQSADAARQIAHAQALNKARQEELDRREGDLQDLERRAAVNLMHKTHGVPLELLEDAKNADQIGAITYRWLYEQAQKPEKPAAETKAQPRRQDTGEGLRAARGVADMSTDEFGKKWDSEKRAAARRVAGG